MGFNSGFKGLNVCSWFWACINSIAYRLVSSSKSPHSFWGRLSLLFYECGFFCEVKTAGAWSFRLFFSSPEVTHECTYISAPSTICHCCVHWSLFYAKGFSTYNITLGSQLGGRPGWGNKPIPITSDALTTLYQLQSSPMWTGNVKPFLLLLLLIGFPGFSRGDKLAGAWILPFTSSAVVKNEWGYTSTSLYVFMPCKETVLTY